VVRFAPSRIVALSVVGLAACSANRPAVRTTAQPDQGSCGAPSGVATHPAVVPQAGKLCVRLDLEPGAVATGSATVVMVWYRPEEKARFEGGLYPPFDLLDAFLERARVVPNVSLDSPAELALDYPGGDAVVFAIADLHHAFWPTMFGGGEGNFIGVSAPAAVASPAVRRVEVKLHLIASRRARPEACAGDRLELIKLEAPELAGSIGNETSRRLCVLLPPSYANEPARRYPVVYLLPGFASGDVAYLRDVRPKVDALAGSGGGEAVIVGVDTSTRKGSAYFTDSAAGGRWDAFAAKMVAEVDGRFRTRAEAKSRAVVGHSTGGFNAVSLALRHPDLFSVVAASAPDALDLDLWLTGADQRVRPRWLSWSRLESAVGGIGQMLSYAAAWSPPGVTFPFDLENGVLIVGAYQTWRDQSPIRMLDDRARVETVRKVLGGRIFLTVGRGDEFGLFPPTKRFSARLSELDIPHQFVITEGGHSSGNVIPALLFAITTMKRR
jgi:S-formylglutathione hydrolase FrmB